jgi:hypothetical protein
MAYHNLTLVRWLVRGLASLFLVDGLVQATAADPHQQLRAAPILIAGMSGLFFANVLARLVIGPAVMTLEPARLRQYWWAATEVGVVWIGVGLVLLYAWQHVR